MVAPGPRRGRLRRRSPGAASRVVSAVAALAALAASVLGASTPAHADKADTGAARATLPAISIIIDDLGYRRLDGLRAIELPGPIAYAILPHTPYATRLAAIAFQLDKEVLLHVPMESDVHKPLGPGAITSDMSRRQVQSVLEAGLASVPHVRGISNHMGGSLTRSSLPMSWVMEWMRTSGDLFFVDSLTNADSVALETAHAAGLRATARDVFLDPRAEVAVVRAQFRRLIALAHARGTALGIGHPYPETLEVLRRVLLKPSHYGVELIPVHELIARRAAHARSSSRVSAAIGQRAAYSRNSRIGH